MFATIYLNGHLQEQIEIYRSMLYRENFYLQILMPVSIVDLFYVK